MPIDLAELVHPDHTVLITSECQRSVVGDLSMLPQLAESAAPAMQRVGALTKAARAAGIQVMHCVYLPRADGKGTSMNTRMAAGLKRRGEASGTKVDPVEAAQVVDAIPVEEADIVMSRMHGMSPTNDTGVDPVLRNLGCTTVVLTGVSLNVAIPNITMDLVNRGFYVVIPRDAVAGVPPEYGEAMLQNTLSMLAFLTTSDELVSYWK